MAKPRVPDGGNAPLASGKWELVDKYFFGPIAALFRKHPVLAAIIVILVLSVVILIWQKQVAYETDFFAFRVRGVPSMESPALQGCISRGLKTGKEYIILSVSMLIRVEDKPSEKLRHSNYRIVYTLLPLKDRAEFQERYTTGNKHAEILHWYGTEPEVGHTDTSYDVKFQVQKGTPYTVVTGADYKYPLPLSANRKAAAEILTLPSNEEFYSYPNTEDQICQLSILIESPTTVLQPAETESGLRYTLAGITGNIQRSQTHFVQNDANGSVGSLSAHWNDVVPSEEVGIHFRW